jgi:hypothetical protein
MNTCHGLTAPIRSRFSRLRYSVYRWTARIGWNGMPACVMAASITSSDF